MYHKYSLTPTTLKLAHSSNGENDRRKCPPLEVWLMTSRGAQNNVFWGDEVLFRYCIGYAYELIRQGIDNFSQP